MISLLKKQLLFVPAALFATLFFSIASFAEAATLSITPDTGVYTAGQTFTARVVVNTQGQTINAADAQITFNPSEISVVSVSQAGSVFGLWAEEPRVSGNQITFSGGAPSGYSGSNGTLATITFRANSAGNKRISFQGGSVLAADGQGTNVLSNMSGATYTVSAVESAPAAERVEYVPPVNTPAAPVITSTTHPDADGWYQATTARLAWTLPAGVTQVRTLLNTSPSSVPTRVYETPINEITLDDLPEGVSYFHIQFRNADGWGQIARYRLAVSRTAPQGVTVQLPEDADLTLPEQKLNISVASSTAPITTALVQIDGAEPISFDISGATSTITLPRLSPGYHALIVEIRDAAGNSAVTGLSFTIDSFSAPEFQSIPAEIQETVIPVFRGTTRPSADVVARIRNVANDRVEEYEVRADEDGLFQVIPNRSFARGVYEISAVATDQSGAVSSASTPVRFVVEQPGYLRVGSLAVSVISVIVPLVAMVILLGLMIWFIARRIRRLRGRVSVESAEAHSILKREFAALFSTLASHEKSVMKSRKTGQLTKAELALIEAVRTQMETSLRAVEKEIQDVEDLVPDK